MKKIAIALLITFYAIPALGAEWIRFDLVKKPYFDPRTYQEIKDISGRKNKANQDPFKGGGKIYPVELNSPNVLQVRQRGTILLLQMDINSLEADIIVLKNQKFENTKGPIKVKYNYSDFNATRLTDQEAKTLMDSLGLESGVTK